MKYLLQARQFEELRQWKTPRSGYRSVSHYSKWKTIGKFETPEEAKASLECVSQTGMWQYRVRHDGETLEEML